jgi:hypothetical protein
MLEKESKRPTLNVQCQSCNDHNGKIPRLARTPRVVILNEVKDLASS